MESLSQNLKNPIILLTKLPSPAPESGVGEAEFGGRKPADVDVEKENTGAKPMEVATEFVRPLSLDSDSSGSGSTVRSRKLWRRNSRSRHSLSQLTSDTDEPAPKSQATDSRGRGRPPSVGKYVGLRKAQLERDKLQREEAKKKADKELEERLHFVKSPVHPRVSDTEEEDRPVLREDLRQCVQVVRTTVRKSGNLKGTSQKALNWVTNKIAKYVDQPESAAIARLESEAKKWQENCARLEAHMKNIQEENTALKRRLEELEAAAKGPTTEEMLAMVEARVQARMESILMGPAQRPSLAHERKAIPGDVQLPVERWLCWRNPRQTEEGEKGKGRGKKTAQPAPAPAPAPTIPAPIAGPSSAPPQAIAGPSTAAVSTPAMAPARRREKSAAAVKKSAPGSKPKKSGRKDPAGQPAPEPRPLPPAPATMETPWVEVARRKKKGKSTATAPTTTSVQPPKPSRRKEPKLRPPRSAAVVISLTPAAVAKGLTYKGVLTDAQNRVDLTGLDISRLKPKFTATGAPMYEVPGANSEERANSFAERLRECFASPSGAPTVGESPARPSGQCSRGLVPGHRGDHFPPPMAPPEVAPSSVMSSARDIPEVSPAELRAAVLRLRSKNTAPGLDGIPGRAWVLALEHLGPRLRRLFSACLEQGRLPGAARFWAPLLWNIGYDWVLRGTNHRGVDVTCYADDTLVTAASGTFQDAAILAAVGTGH
ncbi:tropomyosin-1, isoforms 33/34-like, partial [Manduca sexta]|uniref:tropomyosin-1, isoforms 33/34-like n=1 Tax=Manduca sexta TaxID=7130 RepID=UPI00188FB389